MSWLSEPVRTFPEEDLRDIIAESWDVIARKRYLDYLDSNTPSFMDNSVKYAAERAWRTADNIRYKPHRGYEIMSKTWLGRQYQTRLR
jgi:hypothetical protein